MILTITANVFKCFEENKSWKKDTAIEADISQDYLQKIDKW